MKMLKKLGALLVAVVAVILAKFKTAAIFSAKVLILSAINMALHRDSVSVASHSSTAKPPRQVAQNVTPKTSGAEKVVGPLTPAQSSGPAITPSAPLGAGAIQAARNAASAQNAQLSKETGQAVPTAPGARPTTPTPAAAQQSPEKQPAIVQQGTAKPAGAPAGRTVDSPVMRETFDYTRDTRRDPFVSLMTTSDLRPTLSDLRLTGILYDLSGRRPVAILRDIAGGQWRVTTGMTLGRMRVAQIKPKTIIFTIEEFGFNRKDSLILGDTTRVRHR